MNERETSLISAAQEGDLQAFNQLVHMYQGLAFGVAYTVLGDVDSASDATQDAFIKAFRYLHRFHGGSFKAWLTRIVTNTCYDQLRARKRRQTSSLDDFPNPEQAFCLRDRRRGPQELAENGDLRRIIRIGMKSLPANQRTVIILCDVEGFSYEEIAEVTGARVGTVKSRLSRARAKMRDFLVAQPDLLPNRLVHARAGA
jgi:RNA polymerase sigma-70 factor, ECF subfamily